MILVKQVYKNAHPGFKVRDKKQVRTLRNSTTLEVSCKLSRLFTPFSLVSARPVANKEYEAKCLDTVKVSYPEKKNEVYTFQAEYQLKIAYGRIDTNSSVPF